MQQPPRPRHGPDTTWQTDPWGCRQLEDKIELVFLSVRGDWKTKPVIDDFLKNRIMLDFITVSIFHEKYFFKKD